MENILSILSENTLQIGVPFILSFIIALITIPRVIKFSANRNLYDKPNERKIHRTPISRFGGIAIFIGFFASVLPFIYIFQSFSFIYLFIALVLIFGIGTFDDLKGMRAMDKFYIQIFAAFLVAYGGFRIETLYGLFGVFELPIGMQYILTTIVIVGVTNAYNLIDGIDGLAGGIGFINFVVIGLLGLYFASLPIAIIAFSMAGAILGFLRFNFQPAKIFMGDSGSLLIGFLLATLSIFLLKINDTLISGVYIKNFVIIIGSILFLPVFDTLRVFFLRLLQKRSPFRADKSHIHHMFLEKGYNHKNTALILYMVNIFIIVAGFTIKDITMTKGIVSMFFLFH